MKYHQSWLEWFLARGCNERAEWWCLPLACCAPPLAAVEHLPALVSLLRLLLPQLFLAAHDALTTSVSHKDFSGHFCYAFV